MLHRRRPAVAGLTLTLAVALLAPAAGHAQQDRLSVERIFGSGDFSLKGLPSVHWMNDGQRYTYVTEEGLVAEDAASGRKTVVVDGARLIPAGRTRPIEIEDYTWSDDEKKLLVYTESQPVWRQNTKGKYYVYDVASGRLQAVSGTPGWQQFAKLSPDAGKVAFVRDNDLYVVDLASSRETRLTRDGSETLINGTFDWVYEEELGLQDGWRWSPDGQRIAFWQIDQSAVRTFTWLNDTDSAYSRPLQLRYPKAGAPNPTARIGVVEVSGGRTRWMDTGADRSVYLARMDWAASPDELVIQRLNRHQNRLDVMLADARTGQARVLFTDTDPAWVEVDDDLAFVNGGRQILWTSEKDGWNHLYLYNRDGTPARQLTRGQWEVTSVSGVDAKNGWVYFASTQEGPMQRQVYRVRLSGGAPERLSREPGTHNIALSGGSPYYIDFHSRIDQPTVISLHRTDGAAVRTLVDNAAARGRVGALAIRAPEFFTVRTPDGTELNGWMIKPADFDADKKYPVLMYVYGGPGSQTVSDAWGGSRYLWHQMLAQRGYIVVSVDNRGTGARGSAFRKVGYQKLGKYETEDQIAAARWLARQPYVDAGRLGIWGWSYGGYTTLVNLTDPTNPFKAGIAVAPVGDWRLYDSIYTERFMRTPQENAAGYDAGSPVRRAANLKGDLLIVHGTGDDNVHFQNSVQMADALQAANKQFSFMLYPNRNHSISGGRSAHLYNMLTNWITTHL
jgi:dipeptidyl-peptidase-4